MTKKTFIISTELWRTCIDNFLLTPEFKCQWKVSELDSKQPQRWAALSRMRRIGEVEKKEALRWRRRRRRRKRRRRRRRSLSFCPSTALLLRSHGSLIPLYEKDNSDAQRLKEAPFALILISLLMSQILQSNLPQPFDQSQRKIRAIQNCIYCNCIFGTK